MQHSFSESLAMSHAADELPIWEVVYRQAFPEMIAMHNHRQDGDHQRHGIDRSIVLANSKQLLIDEKVRGRNRITGKVYDDIALEFLSDKERHIPGWVCKPLLCDYIAYAIAPLGRCYLLPVIQLQAAWRALKATWVAEHKTIEARNRGRDREWITVSLCVPAKTVFAAIGACHRVNFEPTELESTG